MAEPNPVRAHNRRGACAGGRAWPSPSRARLSMSPEGRGPRLPERDAAGDDKVDRGAGGSRARDRELGLDPDGPLPHSLQPEVAWLPVVGDRSVDPERSE